MRMTPEPGQAPSIVLSWIRVIQYDNMRNGKELESSLTGSVLVRSVTCSCPVFRGAPEDTYGRGVAANGAEPLAFGTAPGIM